MISRIITEKVESMKMCLGLPIMKSSTVVDLRKLNRSTDSSERFERQIRAREAVRFERESSERQILRERERESLDLGKKGAD
ncbi:unnamed protein product [Camellia sinensis]